jgi:hypothetical protein
MLIIKLNDYEGILQVDAFVFDVDGGCFCAGAGV